MLKSNTFSILLFFIFVMNINTQVNIIGPEEIVRKIRETESGKIQYKIGNFGFVPYGKTILGKLFLIKNLDGTNNWCDITQCYYSPEIIAIDFNDYVPIFFVEHSNDCSYAIKASNVQNRGGKAMIIASESNILDDFYNTDDPTVDPNIPTIIITKEIGDIFREFLQNHIAEKIVLSIKFTGVKEDKGVHLEMFFRSDDIKVLNFFNEFNRYKELLGDKFKFIPRYKYSHFVNENYNNSIYEDNQIPCIKELRLCSTSNSELQISNGRIILLENIRQSCIYQSFGQDVYWNYMIKFNSLCANLEGPTFNTKCSELVFSKIGYNNNALKELNKCMNNLIEYEGKIEEDYMTYNERKIYSVPDLYINGVPFRGSWYAPFIFEGICNGFINDYSICQRNVLIEAIEYKKSQRGLIIFIIVLIFLVTGCSLFFYKRIINRNLEQNLNERIQEQAMKSINKYKIFKENQTQHKLELVNSS